MRIWSIHPKYLDSKGLVAVWRETLLAKKVLEDKTNGYRNHPQLQRFKASDDSLNSINQYLAAIFNEAGRREYCFDKKKVQWDFKRSTLKVTKGQVRYEMEHLKRKLRMRDKKKLREILSIKKIEPHPLFIIVPGKIENWEII
jgi:hypothetical protein